jgi:hypothetical protein
MPARAFRKSSPGGLPGAQQARFVIKFAVCVEMRTHPTKTPAIALTA